MNYKAIAHLAACIQHSIESIEKNIKTSSELVASAKLEKSAVDYFSSAIETDKEAIIELKEFLALLDTSKWAKIKEEFNK